MTFPEGTRFTEEKRIAQSSPYRHLLKPKAGSLAMALNAMGDQFRSLLDVTIVYPDGVPTFWQFLCSRRPRVIVTMRQLTIAPELHVGDYVGDAQFRRYFHRWLDRVWLEKDEMIECELRAPNLVQEKRVSRQGPFASSQRATDVIDSATRLAKPQAKARGAMGSAAHPTLPAAHKTRSIPNDAKGVL
jgi:hypothetical protein